MNIYLENVDLDSNSGPNSFGRKLVKYMSNVGHTFNTNQETDIILAFIQSNNERNSVPLVQRLDGIYFNTAQNYKVQNYFIEETYKKADGVIFQSNFNRDLTFEFFGKHDNYTIIHNGADMSGIEEAKPIDIPDRFSEIWCCASSWRPHKRLDENIKYFLEHSSEQDCLVVAGRVTTRINHSRIFYTGEIAQNELYSLYKASTHLVHLAWLDHCPNVVVDARACGCKIVCSSTGGTKEVAGDDAIMIAEEDWGFEPVNLYQPPEMDFSRKIKTINTSNISMKEVAKKYESFLINTKRKLDP